MSKATRQPAPSRPRIGKERAIECIRELFKVPLQVQELSEDECADSVSPSADFKKSCYDMTFLRLACAIGCRWCTADGKVRDGAPAAFPQSNIVLLDELQSA